MKEEFARLFNENKDKYIRAILTEETKLRAMDFVNRVLPEKTKEQDYQLDGRKKQKRSFNGHCGELAVEALLKKSFVDSSVGESWRYRGADLKSIGLNVGVKTSSFGNFPIVHKQSTIPEIIVIRDNHYFYICGVATPDVLNQYQDDDYIIDSKLRARNVKSGFYGFSHLIPFRSLEELKRILFEIHPSYVSFAN